MRLRQLILQTSLLKELGDFYSNVMQLPVESAGKKEIEIKIGSSELVFQQATTNNPCYHFAINIPSNKIEEAWHWLSSRVHLIWIEQYKSDIAEFTNWNARSVYFFDPAGNIVELIARFDLDNKTEEPFSSQQLLSISEIAIVFKEDELDNRSNNIMQQYNLSYFAKQPPLPHFRALGNDEGLVIIVPENRNWYPTTTQAGIFPMEIYFENEGKSHQLKM